MDIGGEGGIRTPGTLARTPHFECGAIDHSATSPGLRLTGRSAPRVGSAARIACASAARKAHECLRERGPCPYAPCNRYVDETAEQAFKGDAAADDAGAPSG